MLGEFDGEDHWESDYEPKLNKYTITTSIKLLLFKFLIIILMHSINLIVHTVYSRTSFVQVLVGNHRNIQLCDITTQETIIFGLV